ncbi:unnamed protein product [Closterium sp. Yama58-4]|nr:unnamed protein product [Closterium sp. Yama58-4]
MTMNARPQHAPQGAQQPAPTKAELQMAKAQELMRKLNRPNLHEKQPAPESDKKEKKDRPRLSNHDLQQLVNPNLSKMKGPPALSQKIQRQSSGMTCQQNGPACHPPQHAAQFQHQNRPLGQHGPGINIGEASPQLNKNTSLPVGRRNAALQGASGPPNRSSAAGMVGTNQQGRFGGPTGQAPGPGNLGRRVSLPAGFSGEADAGYGSPAQLPPQLSPHGPPQTSPHGPPQASPHGPPQASPRSAAPPPLKSPVGAGMRSPTSSRSEFAGGGGGGMGVGEGMGGGGGMSGTGGETRSLTSNRSLTRMLECKEVSGDSSPRVSGGRSTREGQLRPEIRRRGSIDDERFGAGCDYSEQGGPNPSAVGYAEDEDMYGGAESAEGEEGEHGEERSERSPRDERNVRGAAPPGALRSPHAATSPMSPSPHGGSSSVSASFSPASPSARLPPQRPHRRGSSNVDQLLRTSLEDLQADSRNCRSLCNSNSSSPSVSRCNSVDATNDVPFNPTGEANNGDGAAAAAARGRSRLGPSRQGSLVSGSAAAAVAAAAGAVSAGAGAPAGVARVSGAPQPVALSAAAARKSLQNLRKNPATGGGSGVAGPDFSSSAPAGALPCPRLAAGQQAPPAARCGKAAVARTQSLDCSSGAHLGKLVLKSRAASVDMAGVAAQAAAAVGAAAAGTAAAAAPGAAGAAGGPPVGGKVPKSFSATGAASFGGKASPPVTRVARSLSSLSGELATSSAASSGNSGIGSIAAAAAATATLDDEVCSVEEIRSAFYKAKGGGKGILGFAMRGLSQLSGMLGGGGGLTENVLGREFSAIEKKYFVMMDQELGAGQFGVTRMAKCRQTGKQFACKSICKANLKSKSDLEDIRREVSMLETLRPNPSIARLEEVFEDEEGVHMVMELCAGGELFDKIKEKKRYEEREAVPVMRTILDVLAFCHMRGIVHRDIKPENVLLTSPDSITECKLIDFGVATVVKPGAKPLCDFVGSPFYVAPEVIEGSYGIPADVWSAGVVLYVLLSGVPPFWARTDAGIMKAIKEAKPCFKGEAWRDISLEGVDLIRRMLTRDPKKRLTARAALEHSWFSVWND